MTETSGPRSPVCDTDSPQYDGPVMKCWPAVALAILVSTVPAQEERKPPGSDSAVGLGGGAGGAFGGRGRGRLLLARQKAEDAKAIESGLTWLAGQQREDGAWGTADQADAIATGLTLLAMLGDGNTLRSGPLRENTKNAATWLRDQGDDAGALFASDPTAQAIATLAMIEAYGLSQDSLLKKDTQRAVTALLAARAADGGWSAAGDDPAPTGWAIAALRTAQDFKLESDRAAAEQAAAWLAKHAGDRPQSTAMALFARMLVGGVEAKDAATAAQVALLLAHPIDAKVDDAAYWKFASHALYQIGGEPWTRWSKRFDPLVAAQEKKGDAAGSWSGDVRATALRVLTLQSYYRFARLEPWPE